MNRGITIILGLVLLAISISIYLYIGLNISSRYNVLDDSVSWFHKHVLDYLSSTNSLGVDYNLRLIDGRNMYQSPILLDIIVEKMGVPIQWITIVNGVLGILFVYMISLSLYKDHAISGLSSLLFALTPAFIYWFKPINYGTYIVQLWWFIPLLLLGYGVRRGSRTIVIISSIIFATLWFLWSASWVLYIVYSILIASLIYTGNINRDILFGGLILLLTIPLNLALGLLFISIYHIAAYIMLLIYIIVGSIEYRVTGMLGRIGRNSWRLIGAFSGIALAVGVIVVINPLIHGLGIPEAYTKNIDPVLDYGILSILLLFSLVLLLRARIYRSARENMAGVLLAISVIIGVIASYIDPTLSVFAASAASIIVAFGLKHVFTTLYYNTRGRLKIIYTAVALIIVIGSVAANGLASIYYMDLEPAITYGDLPRDLVEGGINITAFKNALDYIKNSSNGGNVIVLSYWGFSYWITGYIGNNAYTVADPQGSDYGWKYLSKIFLSTDEYNALGMINELRRKIPHSQVYVIVTSVISVEMGGGAGSPNAHLGYPIVLPQATPEQQPQVVYRAVGDPARFPLYIYTIGEDTNKYLDFGRAKYIVQAPLSWSDYGSRTLIVKLVTNAVKALNYTVINDVYSPIPLTVEELKYFKPVKIVEAPFKVVDTSTMKLRVEYMVAVYKVEF